MLRGLEGKSICYSVEITANSIRLSSIENNSDLYQLAPAELIGEAVEGKDISFKIQIENKGLKYEDDFAIYILRTEHCSLTRVSAIIL